MSIRSECDKKASGGVILLTGSTGFVGRRLLSELLKQTSGTIVCLVRAASEADAQARGREISRNLRVVFVPADLEKRKFGITDLAWDTLASRVSEIYHCAASVSFDLPLEESRRINVVGTQSLLSLALSAATHGHFCRFHHVSTAYVAGKKRGVVSPDYLPDHRDSSKFRNSYEQSKAEAESLLRNQSEVPVSIYRPSIITGDTHNGTTDNFNVLYVPMRLISRGTLPFIPAGSSSSLDCIGVDYVVRGIVALGKTSEGVCDSFHLTAGKNCFDICDFVRVSNEVASQVHQLPDENCRVIPYWCWKALQLSANLAQLAPAQFKQLRRWGKLIARFSRGLSAFDSYTHVNTVFECATEQAQLASAQVTQPPALDYLRIITEYAMLADFGAAELSTQAAIVERVRDSSLRTAGIDIRSHATPAGAQA